MIERIVSSNHCLLIVYPLVFYYKRNINSMFKMGLFIRIIYDKLIKRKVVMAMLKNNKDKRIKQYKVGHHKCNNSLTQ